LLFVDIHAVSQAFRRAKIVFFLLILSDMALFFSLKQPKSKDSFALLSFYH